MAEHTMARKTSEYKVPARTYLLWIAIIGLIPLLVIFRQNATNQGQHLSQHEFMQKVTEGVIARATITLDPQSPYLREIRGKYLKVDDQGKKIVENGKHLEVPFYAQVFLTDDHLQSLLAKPEFRSKRPNPLVMNLIWSLGPILLIALLIYFVFIRQIKNAGKAATKFAQSIAHLGSIVQPNPEIVGGPPVFAGTRVPLQNLIDALERGESIDNFLAAFPSVKRNQVIAVIEAGKLKMLETIG